MGPSLTFGGSPFPWTTRPILFPTWLLDPSCKTTLVVLLHVTDTRPHWAPLNRSLPLVLLPSRFPAADWKGVNSRIYEPGFFPSVSCPAPPNLNPTCPRRISLSPFLSPPPVSFPSTHGFPLNSQDRRCSIAVEPYSPLILKPPCEYLKLLSLLAE